MSNTLPSFRMRWLLLLLPKSRDPPFWLTAVHLLLMTSFSENAATFSLSALSMSMLYSSKKDCGNSRKEFKCKACR